MKKTYSPFAMALLVVFLFATHVHTYAQKVRGSGNVTSVDYDVDPFTDLELDGVFNVYINQGDKIGVTVETDENLHDYVVVEGRGDKLRIDTRRKMNIRVKKRMDVYVTVRDLEKLRINGVGNVKTTNSLILKDLDLRIKSVGNVELEIEADNLDGDFDSVGNIRLSGKIGNAYITNGGVGKLAAYDLENEKLKLKASGVGKTEVYATKEIAIKSSGVGNVYYKGDAVITDLNIRGVGKVKKRG